MYTELRRGGKLRRQKIMMNSGSIIDRPINSRGRCQRRRDTGNCHGACAATDFRRSHIFSRDATSIQQFAMQTYNDIKHHFAPIKDSVSPHSIEISGHHMRSASQRKLIVPRYRLNSFGRRCFAVADPSTWNSLPDSLRDPALSPSTFSGVS